MRFVDRSYKTLKLVVIELLCHKLYYMLFKIQMGVSSRLFNDVEIIGESPIPVDGVLLDRVLRRPVLINDNDSISVLTHINGSVTVVMALVGEGGDRSSGSDVVVASNLGARPP
jgi:hypothetical protein